MALSYVTYVGDGATTAYGYGSIAVLEDGVVPVVSQLVVSVDGSIVPVSTYSINTTTSVLTFFTAPADGVAVEIARVTKSDDRYVDWTNATNLSQEQLNLDSDQLLFLAQESLDANQLTIRLNELGTWDAEGKVIANVATGVDSNDAVNVQQLNAAVFGGTPGTVTGQQYVSSDDGTTVFTLPSLAGQTAADVNVYLAGVRLEPLVDYTVADAPDGSSLILTLTSNPGSDLVEIVFITGILAASLAEGAVENENIKDNQITPEKLANPGDRKVLVNDPATGPEWGDLTAADVQSANDVDIPTRPLSQLAAPTSDVSMGNQKITSLADPSGVQDAVNLQTLQNEIASVRSEITDAVEFKKGTVCGTLVVLKTFRDNSSTQEGFSGIFCYWQDGAGKDFPPNGNGAGMKDYTISLDSKPNDWPLDPDLTFLSKDPSQGSMDRDLYDAIALAPDVGTFSPGANRNNVTSTQDIPRSVTTSGGKVFRLTLPPHSRTGEMEGQGNTAAETIRNTSSAGVPENGDFVPDFDLTYLRANGSQWLSTNRGGIIKYYFPYVRVI